MTTTLYGIKNCDTVKKARRWLDNSGIEYQFHDFRADGLQKKQVQAWIDELGWETLINKRSTTWKGLSENARSDLNDKTAADLILEHPTLIKRPLLSLKGSHRVGFKEAEYQSIFS